MSVQSLVNGLPADSVCLQDRGLAYGDGLFRTVKCKAGKLWFWERHMAKLADDARRLQLKCPPATQWLEDIASLAPYDAVVKLTLTRGVSQRGYAADPSAPATRIVQLAPLRSYPADSVRSGVMVTRCNWLLSLQPGLAGIKHLNRLDQVMARREWQDPLIFEGLMGNSRAELVSGVMSNLFLLIGGRLHTHSLHDCGIAGVTRSVVLDCAKRADIASFETALDWQDIGKAAEAMLCNSLMGILPIAAFEHERWQDFPCVTTLQNLFAEMAGDEAVPVPVPHL